MKIFQLLRSDGNYEWELECQFIAENINEATKISLDEYEIDVDKLDEEGDNVFMLDVVEFRGYNIVITKEEKK